MIQLHRISCRPHRPTSHTSLASRHIRETCAEIVSLRPALSLPPVAPGFAISVGCVRFGTSPMCMQIIECDSVIGVYTCDELMLGAVADRVDKDLEYDS